MSGKSLKQLKSIGIYSKNYIKDRYYRKGGVIILEAPKQCPYCNQVVVFTSNKEIYGKEYGNGKCYLCRNCKASVGCHDNGKPLGVLATKEMKVLKTACHDLFDIVWKKKILGRSEAYRRMSVLLGIEQNQCHFGYFDIPMLMKAIHIMLNPHWFREVKNN